MITETAVLLGVLASQVDKSMKLDAEAIKKNSKAFTRAADAQLRLEQCQKNLFNKLETNAKRKNGILTCHLKMFQEQYSIIRTIQFKKGRGIEELEQIDEIQNGLKQYVTMPAVASGMVMKDSQLLITFALKGIGGMMIQDSKANLKIASQNMSKANAIVAQADSICIAFDGISDHVEIITKLLEKLGALYMKSINNLKTILEKNGMDAENYTDEDIDAINLSLDMTKLVFRIVNTPMLDSEGKIEQASMKVISEGQRLIDEINCQL